MQKSQNQLKRVKFQNFNIPFQIQTKIDSLLSQSESVYVRMNHRSALVDMKLAIDHAIKEFDDEYAKEITKSRK